MVVFQGFARKMAHFVWVSNKLPLLGGRIFWDERFSLNLLKDELYIVSYILTLVLTVFLMRH